MQRDEERRSRSRRQLSIPSIAPLLIAVAVAAWTLAPAASASDPLVLQPGDPVDTPSTQCTLNFVFDGPNDAYIGTAGHCADVGDRVSTRGIGTFGTVVYDNNIGGDAVDFALIDVDDDKEHLLSAGLDGHPSTPTGVATPDDTRTGDVLWTSGYGLAVSFTEPTREQRPSVLVSHTEATYKSDGPIVNGDSGAPLVHATTGKALGIISQYGLFQLPPTTDYGPTVLNIIGDLHSNGFDVNLRTAS